jgi:hypothetical protein
MDVLIEKHGLKNNILFKKFINEQLLISTQSFSDTAPIVTGAMGLAYPADTYYPIGGITKPAQLLADFIRNNGGTIILKESVESIDIQDDDTFIVKTAKGNEYQSKHVYNSIPIWNMKKIAKGNAIGNLAEQYAYTFTKAWGAFTAYFAIETEYHPASPYAQIHTTTRIPHCEGDSFFVTWSPQEDSVKAPDGWSTITISTHTEASQWYGLSEEDYARKKEVTLSFILAEFNLVFTQVASCGCRHTNHIRTLYRQASRLCWRSPTFSRTRFIQSSQKHHFHQKLCSDRRYIISRTRHTRSCDERHECRETIAPSGRNHNKIPTPAFGYPSPRGMK